jgi:hypothetical protein
MDENQIGYIHTNSAKLGLQLLPYSSCVFCVAILYYSTNAYLVLHY